MGKLSLKTCSMYTLKKLNEDNSFKVFKMVDDVEIKNHRLLAPLLCWFYLNNLTLKKKGELQTYLNDIRNAFPYISKSNTLNYLKNSNNLDFNIPLHIKQFERKYKYSTLKYSHKELGIVVKS